MAWEPETPNAECPVEAPWRLPVLLKSLSTLGSAELARLEL